MTKTTPSPIGGKAAFTVLGPVALVVFVSDQLTKIWAESALSVSEPARPLIGTLIQLRLIYNPGAALSLGTSATTLLTIVSAAVVVALVWVAPRLTSRGWVVTAALLLGGTAGNLTDRLFRAPGFPKGHVVDFIDYGPFVGNVADIAIVAAAGLIILMSLLGRSPLVEKHIAADTAPAATESTADAVEAEDTDPDDASQGSGESTAQ
jgi:signal peptidase II